MSVCIGLSSRWSMDVSAEALRINTAIKIRWTDSRVDRSMKWLWRQAGDQYAQPPTIKTFIPLSSNSSILHLK